MESLATWQGIPPFHSDLIMLSPPEAESVEWRRLPQWQLLHPHPSLLWEPRSYLTFPLQHDVPSEQGHLSSSFPVYCLKNWEMACWTKAVPQGQAVCNANKYSSQCLSSAIVNHLSLLPSHGLCHLAGSKCSPFVSGLSLPFSYCLGRQLSLSPLSALLSCFPKVAGTHFPQHTPCSGKIIWEAAETWCSKGHRVTSSPTWSLFISGF